MKKKFKPQITIFYCINCFSGDLESSVPSRDESVLKFVKMACSSMVKDVFLLRAFESGSDAVVVMVCPEGQCRYVEGNIRAKKRIEWVKKLLDEIELNGRRLSLHHIDSGNPEAASAIVDQVLANLGELGPNPAR